MAIVSGSGMFCLPSLGDEAGAQPVRAETAIDARQRTSMVNRRGR
jgi:hypothetical protein